MRWLSLILIISIIVYGCDDGKETSISGKYKFTKIKAGVGTPAKDGEYILLNFKGIDANDSIWFDRKMTVDPFSLKKNETKWKAGEDWIYEVFYDVVKGDSIRIDVSPSDFLSNSMQAIPSPSAMPDRLSLYAGVFDIVNYEDYLHYMTVTLVKYQEDERRRVKENFEREQAAIRSIIAKNNWVSDSTYEGLKVVILQDGEGEKAKSGQKVTVQYTGSLLDSTIFDSSLEDIAKKNNVFNPNRKYEPYTFVVNQSNVIKGWHEGIKFLNVGAKAILFIPYSLGFGEDGDPPLIEPYSTLKYEVELINIE